MPVARGVAFSVTTSTRQRMLDIKALLDNASERASILVDSENQHVGGMLPADAPERREIELIANAIESVQDQLAVPLDGYDRFLFEAGGRSRDEVASYWKTAERALEGARDFLDSQDWRKLRAALRGSQRAIRAVCRIGRIRS